MNTYNDVEISIALEDYDSQVENYNVKWNQKDSRILFSPRLMEMYSCNWPFVSVQSFSNLINFSSVATTTNPCPWVGFQANQYILMEALKIFPFF